MNSFGSVNDRGRSVRSTRARLRLFYSNSSAETYTKSAYVRLLSGNFDVSLYYLLNLAWPNLGVTPCLLTQRGKLEQVAMSKVYSTKEKKCILVVRLIDDNVMITCPAEINGISRT